ncbi:hypothetical protein AAHA92_18274 [Salvia divinorum]|uniref:Uncharacterized protein n=1 Tax=Salvia divinorum TaxID=28513 RepID=A0ABD1H214_SALDI
MFSLNSRLFFPLYSLTFYNQISCTPKNPSSFNQEVLYVFHKPFAIVITCFDLKFLANSNNSINSTPLNHSRNKQKLGKKQPIVERNLTLTSYNNEEHWIDKVIRRRETYEEIHVLISVERSGVDSIERGESRSSVPRRSGRRLIGSIETGEQISHSFRLVVHREAMRNSTLNLAAPIIGEMGKRSCGRRPWVWWSSRQGRSGRGAHDAIARVPKISAGEL